MIRKLFRFRQRKSRRGYSLIEVMIGMIILGVCLASSFALSATNARLIEKNQNLAAAANLAEYKLEDLRNRSFDSIVAGSDGPMSSTGSGSGIFTRAWTVTEGAPAFFSTDLKTVTVVVSWNQWGSTHSFSLTGVIKR